MPIDPTRPAAYTMLSDIARGPAPAQLAAQDQAWAQAMGDLRKFKLPPPLHGQALVPYQGGMVPRGGPISPFQGGGMPAVQGGVPVAYSGGGAMAPMPGGPGVYGAPRGLPAGQIIDTFGRPVTGSGPFPMGGGAGGTGPVSSPVSVAGRTPFIADNRAANQIGSAVRGAKGAGWSQSSLPGVLGKAGKIGGVARLGGGMALSYGGDMLGNALGADTAQGQFAKGAGMGAGIGMWAGPLGALAGAGIGGGLGVLLGGKGGKGKAPIANLSAAMNQAGFAPQASQQLMTYYNVLAQMGGNTKEAKTQAFNTVVPLFQEMLASQMGLAGGGQGAGGVPTPADYAALQAETARFMQPYQKAALVNGQLQADYLSGDLDSLPPAYRGVMKAGAMSGQIASTNLANAYGAQAQLAPLAAAIQTGQSQLQSAANSLYAQGLNNALSGGGSGAVDPFAAAGL